MKKSLLFLFMLLTTAGIAFAGDGTKENPYTVEEAVAANIANNTAGVWVQGYIVGWNNGAVFAPDVKFSADGAGNNNIVLASSADATSPLIYITNNFKDDLSIQNHPDILGRQVAVEGKVATMVNKSWDSITDFYWVAEEGGEDPEPGVEEGDGTEAKPYSVAQLVALGDAAAGDMWFEGYLVAVAAGNPANFDPVEFGLTGTQAQSYPTRMIADSKDCKDKMQCIALWYAQSVLVDPLLDVTTTPEQMGKKFKIHAANPMNAGGAGITFGNIWSVAEVEDTGSEEPGLVSSGIAFLPATNSYTGDFTKVIIPEGNLTTETNKTDGPKFGTGNPVTINWYRDNSSISNASADLIKWYKNDVLKINPISGCTITKVEYTCTNASSKKYALTATASDNTTLTKSDDGLTFTWTGESTSTLSLTASEGQIRANSIIVEYTYDPNAKQPCEAPVFTPANGSVVKKNSYVTIASATEGAKIYYTTNGSTPTPGAEGTTEYAAPGVFIDKTTSIKAIAVADGMTDSEVVLASFYVPVKVTSIDEFKTDNQPATYYELQTVMTVTYAKGSRCFVKDETGSLLLYVKDFDFNSLNLKNGDFLNGVIGKYETYGGMVPEMTEIVKESIVPVTGTTPVDPVESTVKDVAPSTMNDYMVIKGVTIAPSAAYAGKENADKYFDITDASGTVLMYNQFGIEITATAEGETADIVGIPSAYSGNPQYCPIEITINKAPVTGGDDLMKEGDGLTAETAMTVDQFLEMAKVPGDVAGKLFWIKGYVVGSAAGSADYTSTTPYFGNEDPVGQMLLLANTKDCTNFDKCANVNLDWSDHQQALNLQDHPELYGAVVAVYGNVTSLNYGHSGVSYVEKYQILAPAEGGGEEPEPGVEEGDGSEAKPYSVAQVIALENAAGDMWFQGYLVAVAAGSPMNFSSVEFGLTGTPAQSFPTRMIADSKTCTDKMQCIALWYPQATMVNSLLDVTTKPEQMGKKFKIHAANPMNTGGAGMVFGDIWTVIELSTTGIDAAEVDDNAPVEYYNLQGMPVSADNLRAGQIYVRRQGASVAKILVK